LVTQNLAIFIRMHRYFLHQVLLLLFLLGSSTAFANQVFPFFVSKEGVSLYDYYDEGDTLSQKKELESYLDFILQNIERREDNLQILIFPNVADSKEYGFCASYSSLEKGDTVFVSEGRKDEVKIYYNDYYPYQAVRTVYGNNIPSGLIIRFPPLYDSTIDNHDRILSIINFAIRNIETIKAEQKYLHVRGFNKHDTTSILTYDTAKLNAVKTENYGFVKGKDYSNKTRNMVLAVLVGLSIISIAFIAIRSRKRANALNR
jgi:hypothetical protein